MNANAMVRTLDKQYEIDTDVWSPEKLFNPNAPKISVDTTMKPSIYNYIQATAATILENRINSWALTYPDQPAIGNIGIELISPQQIYEIQGKLNSLLQFNILIQNQNEVINYLIEHQDLVNLLTFIAKIARKHVGNDPQLSIGICTDPEGGESHLSLYIRMQDYSDEIFNIIDTIESEYIDRLDGKSGWIIVTTDFKSPE